MRARNLVSDRRLIALAALLVLATGAAVARHAAAGAAPVRTQEVRAHGTGTTFRLVAGGHAGWAGRMPTYLRWPANACP